MRQPDALIFFCLVLLLAACTNAPEADLAPSDAPTLVVPEAEFTIQDAEAEGGEAAILYSNDDRAVFRLDDVPAGAYRVSVRAKAREYKGWPVMRLRLGRERLGEDNSVERERYGAGSQQRFGEVALELGQVITAEFVNDLFEGSEDRDRNLIVDHLMLEPVRSDSESQPPDTEGLGVQLLIDDMRLPHESQPSGVPEETGWRDEPRVGMGNDPGDFRALTAWGQLYEAAEGNPATNTRVQIRDLKTYILSRSSGTWQRVEAAPRVEGAAYREDYQGDVSKPADLRKEASGGVSVTAGNGYNFHFWPPTERVSIDPDDIAGVVTTVQARLIVGDEERPDDRSKARYILSVGADYWLDQDAQWDYWTTNGDIGIGRFKYVAEEWGFFTMNTLSAEALRDNPPPLR